MTTEFPRPFGARRALLVFLAYVAVQFGTGIVTGILVAIWYAATRGLRTPGVAAEAMGTATMLGAIRRVCFPRCDLDGTRPVVGTSRGRHRGDGPVRVGAPDGSVGQCAGLVAITGLGIATLSMRIVTRSLVPSILLHIAYNTVLAVAVLGSLA